MLRCTWANKSELDIYHHDHEWGKVLKDENKFFEMISLECFQAGLSWSGILKKRSAMRTAFDNFDASKIALYDDDKIEKFMQDSTLIRNRAKLKALVSNAKVYLEIKAEFGGFYEYLWQNLLVKFDPKFNQKQIINHYNDALQIPATTPMSDFVTKELKKRGFKFLGSTSVYALLQSVGVVDDHLDWCFCKGKGSE
ncbi:DNA-3-methyladenine glycosylase I [Campylobacter suis]|uniref:DNA-3-methyladenine glycosylase 1 n=1 Tax=Campylobacter suis TaxID=2790657 RepID=A0ABN7K9W4_9BACT|nr:DNA-3-methyladenine glycosylase I [Campylobacter suis]CAD7288536.1 DNA-3-methyladenine glycosylase 1 [Campylobacter suis]